MKTILQLHCTYCKKTAQEVSRVEVGKELAITLSCGHLLIKPSLSSLDIDITSSDGKKPFHYQITGAKFLEEADCNALCLDEQGLGKTIEECLLLKRNKDLLPALIVCKSGLRIQWFLEILRWTGIAPQIIANSRDQPLFEFFPIVIISIDTLRLIRPDIKVQSEWDSILETKKGKKKNYTPTWTDEVCARFKHICIDEIQKVKNPTASRTQALRKIVSLANNGQKARVIGLSGTPIDKHAGEFFVALNLIRPELFPHQSTYQLQFCQINPYSGKIGGLKNADRFRDLTESFIIRRKREEVLPDLPKVFRQFRFADLEGDELTAYIKLVQEFQEFMESEAPKIPLDILGRLSKLRHITGIAKVSAAVEFIEEFLLSHNRKLVIFLHHKRAAAMLLAKLSTLCTEGAINQPLVLSSELDVTARSRVVEEFKRDGNRLLIASTQVAAEGLNLQFCSDCLFMERQWNPTIEEQGESRFPRPGQTADKINATYLIAAGTVDDFLTDIVEEKRRHVASVIDGKETWGDEGSLAVELAEVIRVKGLKKWSL